MFDYIFENIRAAAVLGGTSYTADGTISDVQGQDKLVLLVEFTKGSSTSAEIKVEFSPDNSNYYQETTRSDSSGTITEYLAEHKFTATGNYRIPISIKDRYIRISSKGTGTLTGSSLKIGAVIGQDLD